MVKQLQPQASQRAIAEMVGVSNTTIAEDLGTIDKRRNVVKTTGTGEESSDIVVKTTPLVLPPDDFDAVGVARKQAEKIKRHY